MAELLKSVIWQLDDPYRMKRRGILSTQGDGSTGGHDVHELKRAGIRELVKNEQVANRTRRIAKYPG